MLVVDDRTEDSFAVPASPMARLFYAFSSLHCLAVSMQDGGAGTGTVMRSATLREYAEQAGLSTMTCWTCWGIHQKARGHPRATGRSAVFGHERSLTIPST